jgi:hypothetical protein
MIDGICNDEPGGDLFIAFMGGGLAAGFLPGFNGPLDAGFGMITGSGTNALGDAINSGRK